MRLDIGELLTVSVTHNEAVRRHLGSPWRRKPAGGHGNVPLKSNFFDSNQRTQDRISVSIVELESGATMTEELRVIIFIALGLSGVVGVWQRVKLRTYFEKFFALIQQKRGMKYLDYPE
jgi:hypothetical protein